MLSHLDRLRTMINDPPTKWIKLSGIQAEIVEQGHIKLTLPVKEMHLNHVNTVYAGSMFTLAEICGGAAFQATYGFDKYAPIVKKAAIRFIKPATTDLTCELKITDEEAMQKIAPIDERGKGDFMMEIPLHDISGETVAIAEINYYIIPIPKK